MKALLLLTLACVSCAANGPYYNFAFEGPPEDYELAVHAAAEWSACGPVDAHVSYGRMSDNDVPIVFGETLYGISVDSWIMGIYHWSPRPGSIEYTHRGDTQGVIAHEMGHAFGLGHFGAGLMSPNMLSPHVTDQDCSGLEGR